MQKKLGIAVVSHPLLRLARLAHGHRHRMGFVALELAMLVAPAATRPAGPLCRPGNHRCDYLGGDDCLCVRLPCGWLADFPDDRPWFRRAGIGLCLDQNRGNHVFRTGLAMIDAIEPEAELFALAEQVDLAEKAFHDALARRNEAQIAFLHEPSIMREAFEVAKTAEALALEILDTEVRRLKAPEQ